MLNAGNVGLTKRVSRLSPTSSQSQTGNIRQSFGHYEPANDVRCSPHRGHRQYKP